MAVPLLRRFDLGPRKHLLRSFARPTMRLADDVRQSVVFIGHGSKTEFKSCGTAFLMRHHGTGAEYLVTARHIAEGLDDDPFSIRINRKDGAVTIRHDPALENGDGKFSWIAHTDPAVDLAVMPFNIDLKSAGCDHLFLMSEMAISEEWRLRENIGCGQFCYAVGLFARHQGRMRNLPVVHTGHIALMPSADEPVLVKSRDRRELETVAYLVELSNLSGLSGAPVFVRPDLEIGNITCRDNMLRDALIPQASLFLLGIWQGSWEEPDESGGRVPVGMGVVTPAERLIEILESDAAVQAREHWQNLERWKDAAASD